MAPDTLSVSVLDSAPRGDAHVTVNTADSWVVTYGTRCPIQRKIIWSAEAFSDLNEAVDFYGEWETGDRSARGYAGSVVAYRDGRVIGEIPMRRVAAMVREGRQA